MQHALVQYLMDMQKGRDEKRLDALDTEQLREMREELANLEPAGVGRFVLSELDKKLEESFSRVPPDHRSLRPDWIDEQMQYLADTEAEAVPVSGDAVPF